MTVKFVENSSANWMTAWWSVDLGALHSAWEGNAPGSGPAPPRTQGAIRPLDHELRPGERYYWVEGGLPPMPPVDDPRWKVIHLCLLNTVDNKCAADRDPRLATFCGDVWTSKPPGHIERMSFGAWNHDYAVNYWFSNPDGTRLNGGWAHEIPLWRRVGAEFWADGHAGGNHYRNGTWCLENARWLQLQGRQSEADRAWEQAVLCALHLAGQGTNHDTNTWNYGGTYNEKSPWIWAGDYAVGSKTPWSHRWGELIHYIRLLTGELADVSQALINFAWYHPAYYTGSWGTRAAAWYLNEGLVIDKLFPGHVVADDTRAFDVIDKTFLNAESQGLSYWPNAGSSWNQSIETWQAWLFIEKALLWGIHKGRADEIYNRAKPFIDWQVANAMNQHGFTAYLHTDGSPAFTSFIHTSYALPVLAEMVRRGDYDQAKLKQSCEVVIENLPYTTDDRQVFGRHRAGRGLLWCRKPDVPGGASQQKDTRPWGGGSPKIAGNAMQGLRGDVLHLAGY